jgi:hypothetical protein
LVDQRFQVTFAAGERVGFTPVAIQEEVAQIQAVLVPHSVQA